MTLASELTTARLDEESIIVQGSFVCDECQRLSVGVARARGMPTNAKTWLMNNTEIAWLPERAAGKDFPDVDEPIAAAADEAYRCLSADAPRGAIALARAVVEATAKHHGITSGNLMNKIDAMAEKGLISDHMKDAAHEIRFAGNEIAHGDLAEEPLGKEDAREVLELMDAILHRVFQEPAQIAKVRKRREERTA